MSRYLSYIVQNHVEISNLDPLNLDEDFIDLPIINKNKDVDSLFLFIEKVKVGVKNVDLNCLSNCHASLRDIGFIISSLRKLNIQPVENDIELTKILNFISSRIGMVPRETSYHYGLCNPKGRRQRTFTNYQDELGLIEGVRIFAKDLEVTLFGLLEIKQVLLGNQKKTDLLFNNVIEEFSTTLNNVWGAMKKISPQIFSHELRPFFDPIIINGHSYIGPGGGQVPLLIIDNILFAFSLSENHIYRVFSNEGVNFLTPELFSIYNKNKTEPTILDLCNDKTPRNIMNFLISFFDELIRYRQYHLSVAKRSLSKKNRGNYETGSAGYRMEMVKQTLLATKEARDLLNKKILK